MCKLPPTCLNSFRRYAPRLCWIIYVFIYLLAVLGIQPQYMLNKCSAIELYLCSSCFCFKKYFDILLINLVQVVKPIIYLPDFMALALILLFLNF